MSGYGWNVKNCPYYIRPYSRKENRVYECYGPWHEQLHHAAMRMQLDKVKELFARETIDVNKVDCKGKTPLHHAINPQYLYITWMPERRLGNQPEIVRILLDHGAYAGGVNQQGETFLHQAVLKSNTRLMKVLLEYGADADTVDIRGNRPLHHCCSGCKVSVRKLMLFLDHGVDVNAQDPNGDTPLHRAVRDRCGWALEFIPLLLSAGADINIRNLRCPESQQFSCILDHNGNLRGSEHIIPHMIRMEAAGIALSSDNREKLARFANVSDENRRICDQLQLAARAELATLKEYQVQDSTTLYDILMSPYLSYIGNRTLVDKLSKIDYEAFPEYKLLLRAKLRKPHNHLELERVALYSLLELRSSSSELLFQSLPQEMLREILKHMKAVDLRNLISCCEKLHNLSLSNLHL